MNSLSRAPAPIARPAPPRCSRSPPLAALRAAAHAIQAGHAAASRVAAKVSSPRRPIPSPRRATPIPRARQHATAAAPTAVAARRQPGRAEPRAGRAAARPGAPAPAAGRAFQAARSRADSGAFTPHNALPTKILQVIAGGNAITDFPYLYGGGHGSFVDRAYDCSGSVSYALAAAGLIASPRPPDSSSTGALPARPLPDGFRERRAHVHDRRRRLVRHRGTRGSVQHALADQQPSLAGYAVRHYPGFDGALSAAQQPAEHSPRHAAADRGARRVPLAALDRRENIVCIASRPGPVKRLKVILPPPANRPVFSPSETDSSLTEVSL